jgi:hypothetical protein
VARPIAVWTVRWCVDCARIRGRSTFLIVNEQRLTGKTTLARCRDCWRAYQRRSGWATNRWRIVWPALRDVDHAAIAVVNQRTRPNRGTNDQHVGKTLAVRYDKPYRFGPGAIIVARIRDGILDPHPHCPAAWSWVPEMLVRRWEASRGHQ